MCVDADVAVGIGPYNSVCSGTDSDSSASNSGKSREDVGVARARVKKQLSPRMPMTTGPMSEVTSFCVCVYECSTGRGLSDHVFPCLQVFQLATTKRTVPGPSSVIPKTKGRGRGHMKCMPPATAPVHPHRMDDHTSMGVGERVWSVPKVGAGRGTALLQASMTIEADADKTMEDRRAEQERALIDEKGSMERKMDERKMLEVEELRIEDEMKKKGRKLKKMMRQVCMNIYHMWRRYIVCVRKVTLVQLQEHL